MIVRKATLRDLDALAAILNEIIAIGGTTAFEEPLEPAYFDQFIDALDPKVFLFVAEAEGIVVGLQWIEPLDPPNEHLGGIATFAQPGTTQRGIGSAMIEATRAASLAAGYSGIEAKIRADNTGGLAYYSKMGFEDHSVTRGVPLSDSTPIDRVHKRLTLPPPS